MINGFADLQRNVRIRGQIPGRELFHYPQGALVVLDFHQCSHHRHALILQSIQLRVHDPLELFLLILLVLVLIIDWIVIAVGLA